jgi:hypothetical protein
MNGNPNPEKHLLYWICIAVTLLGIRLIVVSFHIPIFSLETRSIETALVSIGIIGFIFQYYFQTSLEKRLKDSYVLNLK